MGRAGPDPLALTASELAALVRNGEISALELTTAALERIESTRDLGHWTLVDADGALAAAEAIGSGDPRPFAGVPLAIKDLFAPVAGLRMANGSSLFGEYVPGPTLSIDRPPNQPS